MKYIGFYWTLPVGWLGIRDLPKDAEEAAKYSKTIRYQRAFVKNWVTRQNEAERFDKLRHELIAEVTYIDKRPDRPTHALLLDAMMTAGRDAARHGAILLIVEFGLEYRQLRSIRALAAELESSKIPYELLEAEPHLVDGELFIPHQHFLKWKQNERVNKAEQLQRAVSGLSDAVAEIGLEGEGRYLKISKLLNDRKVLEHNSV